MIVIGIVGGIASGKSFVTAHLQSLGGIVLDADQIGHQVLLQQPVKQAIREQWGDQVFDCHGEVDRRKLAKIVFDPEQPEQLICLEKITHPRIQHQLKSQIESLRNQVRDSTSSEDEANHDEGTPFLILDAPVMVKSGWHVLCDELVFVEASDNTRWQRASKRGWTQEMFKRREAMQAPLAEKRRLANHVIENNGEPSDTIKQVDQLWDRFICGNPKPVQEESS